MVDFGWDVSASELKSVLKSDFKHRFPDVSFEYRDDLFVGTGKSGETFAQIGVDGLCRDTYFSLVRAVFHESRHVKQYCSNFSCCGQYATECRFDDIACHGSRLYYGVDFEKFSIPKPWYYHNIRELDAEMNGFFGAYDFLSIDHPSFYHGDLDGAFLKHMNSLHRDHDDDPLDYFIDFKDPFKSLDDIEDRFYKELQNSVLSKHVGYDYRQDVDSCIGGLLACSGSGFDYARCAFEEAGDGFEERRIAAGLVRAVHPEYTKDLTMRERQEIGTWVVFHEHDVPKIPGRLMKKFDALPDSERRKYYLVSVNKLFQYGNDTDDGYDREFDL